MTLPLSFGVIRGSLASCDTCCGLPARHIWLRFNFLVVVLTFAPFHIEVFRSLPVSALKSRNLVLRQLWLHELMDGLFRFLSYTS